MTIKFNLKNYIEQRFEKEYYKLESGLPLALDAEKYELVTNIHKTLREMENTYIDKAVRFGQPLINDVYINILGYDNPNIKGYLK